MAQTPTLLRANTILTQYALAVVLLECAALGIRSSDRRPAAGAWQLERRHACIVIQKYLRGAISRWVQICRLAIALGNALEAFDERQVNKPQRAVQTAGE